MHAEILLIGWVGVRHATTNSMFAKACEHICIHEWSVYVLHDDPVLRDFIWGCVHAWFVE